VAAGVAAAAAADSDGDFFQMASCSRPKSAFSLPNWTVLPAAPRSWTKSTLCGSSIETPSGNRSVASPVIAPNVRPVSRV
jgi:hypothetical protein